LFSYSHPQISTQPLFRTKKSSRGQKKNTAAVLNKSMADSVLEAVQQAAENITENANAKVPASPEGMALAYGSLIVMALLPIYFGSKRSVSHQKEQKESSEKPDIMTKKDAMMFPVS
jgi:hypothetical protein